MKGTGARAFLLLLILAALVPALAGCGHEPAFGEDGSPPLSGDVAVLGYSLEGLVAALEAADQGAAVMVFYEEEEPLPAGGFRWQEGVLCPADDSPEAEAELKAALQSSGAGQSYIDFFCRHIEEDLTWLTREIGVRWSPLPEAMLCRPQNTSEVQFYRRLEEAARKKGVRFFSGTSVTEIRLNSAERVEGLTIEKEGIRRQVFAPTVILSGGGYLGNRELMSRVAPRVTPAPWGDQAASSAVDLALSLDLDLTGAHRFLYSLAVEENGRWKTPLLPEEALLIAGSRIVPVRGKSAGELVQAIKAAGTQKGYLLMMEPADPQARGVAGWRRYDNLEAFMKANDLDLPLLRSWFSRPWQRYRGIEVQLVAEYCLGGIAASENGELLRRGKPVAGLYGVGEIAAQEERQSLLPGEILAQGITRGRFVGSRAALAAQG